MSIQVGILKLGLFLPLVYAIFLIITQDLGADPTKSLNHFFGRWGFYFLIFNLWIGSILSLFKFVKKNPWKIFRPLNLIRRWLGVIGFLYLLIHFVFYFFMEGFSQTSLGQNLEKNYLLFGFLSFLVISVLAMTSNNFSVQRMGAHKWKGLHRGAYFAFILILFHVFQIEKADLIWFAQWSTPLALILGFRGLIYLKNYLANFSRT